MDRVLGRNVGNAVEVVETVEYLKGEGTRDPRLHEVTMALAGEMVGRPAWLATATKLSARSRAIASVSQKAPDRISRRRHRRAPPPLSSTGWSSRSAGWIRPSPSRRAWHQPPVGGRPVGLADHRAADLAHDLAEGGEVGLDVVADKSLSSVAGACSKATARIEGAGGPRTRGADSGSPSARRRA